MPGSGGVPDGQPFLTYGIWVLPFTHIDVGLTVFLVDRPIKTEPDHKRALAEAFQKLKEVIARP